MIAGWLKLLSRVGDVINLPGHCRRHTDVHVESYELVRRCSVPCSMVRYFIIVPARELECAEELCNR